jgi:hypothetical protein
MLNALPDDSRIWVFIPDRELTDTEKQDMLVDGKAFIAQWSSHGKLLNAQCEMLGSAWILAADEREVQASGCSMDKINLFIKAQGTKMKVDFFNRMNVLERKDGHWYVTGFQLERLDSDIHSALIQLGELRPRLKG